MKIKHLKPEKAAKLERTISFLSNYMGAPANELHIISIDGTMDGKDEELTDILTELGEINRRRQEIIEEFLNFDVLK